MPVINSVAWWEFRAPDGQIISGFNLIEVIRLHEHLFDEDDVRWELNSSKRAYQCKASSRLYQLAQVTKAGTYRNKSWKGWRLTERMAEQHLEQILAHRGQLSIKKESDHVAVQKSGSQVHVLRS